MDTKFLLEKFAAIGAKLLVREPGYYELLEWKRDRPCYYSQRSIYNGHPVSMKWDAKNYQFRMVHFPMEYDVRVADCLPELHHLLLLVGFGKGSHRLVDRYLCGYNHGWYVDKVRSGGSVAEAIIAAVPTQVRRAAKEAKLNLEDYLRENRAFSRVGSFYFLPQGSYRFSEDLIERDRTLEARFGTTKADEVVKLRPEAPVYLIGEEVISPKSYRALQRTNPAKAKLAKRVLPEAKTFCRGRVTNRSNSSVRLRHWFQCFDKQPDNYWWL